MGIGYLKFADSPMRRQIGYRLQFAVIQLDAWVIGLTDFHVGIVLGGTVRASVSPAVQACHNGCNAEQQPL